MSWVMNLGGIIIIPLFNCLVAGSVRHVDVDQHHHQQEGGEGPVAEPHGPGQPQLGPVVLRGVWLLAAPVPGLHAPALPGQLLHQLLPHHTPLLQEAAVHDVTIQVSHLQSCLSFKIDNSQCRTSQSSGVTSPGGSRAGVYSTLFRPDLIKLSDPRLVFNSPPVLLVSMSTLQHLVHTLSSQLHLLIFWLPDSELPNYNCPQRCWVQCSDEYKLSWGNLNDANKW